MFHNTVWLQDTVSWSYQNLVLSSVTGLTASCWVRSYALVMFDAIKTGNSPILIKCLCSPELIDAGAHNDVRVEGKGRSVQRPRRRLKLENFLTVVPLLFLVCTWTCTNTCTETSQRTRKRKASTRTPFVVKQRKEMVTNLEKCCTTT